MRLAILASWLQPQRLLDLAFRFRPGDEFLVCGSERLTRGQAYAGLRGLAAGLQALGIEPGERVATLLPACPKAVYALFLPPLAGTVHVPLNPLLGEDELRHILADCGARAVIAPERWYGRDYPALLARLLPDLPDLRYVLIRGGREGDGRVFWPLREVMRPQCALRPVRIAAPDTSLVGYTASTPRMTVAQGYTVTEAIYTYTVPAQVKGLPPNDWLQPTTAARAHLPPPASGAPWPARPALPGARTRRPQP